MDLGDLIHFVSSGGAEFLEFVHTNFDPVKAATIAFAAISSIAGIWIQWRNSGYRQVDRLREFLEDQEQRLESGRDTLSKLFELPSPDVREGHTVFSREKLGRSLRAMNWGFGTASPRGLKDAIVTTSNQADIAGKTAREHLKRKALAHLLQGARLAAKQLSDDIDRCKSRTEALEHFRAALKIDSKDADALEYALMMTLELANPHGVLDEIDDLIALRIKTGGMPLARSYRIKAMAYERLPAPQFGNANSAMLAGIEHLPNEALLEKAMYHEHHGLIRMKARTFGVANQSLQQAQMCYQHLANAKAGKEGLLRVARHITRLNALADGDASTPATTTAQNVSWFTKLSKHNG